MEKETFISKNVYFRGLIEFSNICSNDCGYCGIRKSNDIERYFMTKEEIMKCVEFCQRYGSIVLQSGERQDKEFIDFVEDALKETKLRFPSIGITLSVGEQSKEVYQRFFDAGAHRYLLRIETSDKEHYEKLHPASMSFDKRVQCLKDLRDIGYQVGTGVMIGSPGQTAEMLDKDLAFFKEMDVDMVGMGPFLPCKDKDEQLKLSLNMITKLRVLMPDINIAAATALQAIDPLGREKGLKAGANILMPIATPQKYRKSYKLYEDKPCVNESSDECLNCITKRVESSGFKPCFGEWGDSLHYASRKR